MTLASQLRNKQHSNILTLTSPFVHWNIFSFSLIVVSDAHINHLEILSYCDSSESTKSTLMFPPKFNQPKFNLPIEEEWQHKEEILF